ncbi:unnamed protein product [Arabis nemorensis]|uniref:Uncharacterized protein n=1 Tax=Arabis nemorensis TaxID=586526 RepID=A0A565CVU0_9BRAS|nr:unnamed protein product [Arabis nemorensis]
MNFSIFSRKKPSGFIDLYTELTKTLTETYLPLLRQSRSSDVLSTNIDRVLSHLNKYYETIPTRLSTSSLETPFLLLGDIYPYIFTNLLRTFIDQDTQDSGHVSIAITQEADLSTEFLSAWTEPSDQLLTRINGVECRTRMIVPNLLERLRIVQRGYVARILKKPITAKTVKDET